MPSQDVPAVGKARSHDSKLIGLNNSYRDGLVPLCVAKFNQSILASLSTDLARCFFIVIVPPAKSESSPVTAARSSSGKYRRTGSGRFCNRYGWDLAFPFQFGRISRQVKDPVRSRRTSARALPRDSDAPSAGASGNPSLAGRFSAKRSGAAFRPFAAYTAVPVGTVPSLLGRRNRPLVIESTIKNVATHTKKFYGDLRRRSPGEGVIVPPRSHSLSRDFQPSYG